VQEKNECYEISKTPKRTSGIIEFLTGSCKRYIKLDIDKFVVLSLTDKEK